MEPSDGALDLVGRTSARLTAAGVPRHDRLDALHLLAVLDASADDAGRIRRPIDDLAGEFELSPMSVMRALDHLQEAGALERDGGAVVLLDREPGGVGGMHLAAFLDDVRASLDEAPLPRSSPWRVRASAGLVAALAALGVLSLAPSQHPGSNPAPVAAGGTTTSIEPTTSAPTTPSDAAPAVSPFSPERTTSGSANPVDAGVVAAGRCPTGEPTVELEGSILRITNPTTSDLVITALTVSGVPTATSLRVAAGETLEHAAPVASAAALPTSIDDWDWADRSTDGSCPS